MNKILLKRLSYHHNDSITNTFLNFFIFILENQNNIKLLFKTLFSLFSMIFSYRIQSLLNQIVSKSRIPCFIEYIRLEIFILKKKPKTVKHKAKNKFFCFLICHMNQHNNNITFSSIINQWLSQLINNWVIVWDRRNTMPM